MSKLLEVKNLEISFQTFFGEVEAVRNVSFDLYTGETLAIVGESGCGKSVTASSIIRLLPQPPAFYKGGSILFDGEEIITKTEREMQAIRGNQISMVFQDPMTSLNPTKKIGFQISEGLMKHQKLSRSDAEKRVVEMLDMVSVPEPEKRIHQYPHEFSGGMRQRVMIAIAMVAAPKLLIADEPTTALDVTVQAQIMDLMKKLKDKLSMGIILITHDLGVVADMADKILVMYAGQIVEQGKNEEIFANPRHPYTRALLASVPRPDMSKSERIHSIEGSPPDLYIPPKGCSFYDRCQSAMHICKEHCPEFSRHTDTHISRCWLNHPLAAKKHGKGVE